MGNQRRPTKIVISNIVSLNTGDAAILWGMFDILRDKYGEDSEFVVFDKSAEVASRYYPWANFRQSIFGRSPKTWLGKKLSASGYGHWNDRFRFLVLASVAKLMRFKLGFLGRLLASRQDCDAVKEYVGADLILSAGGTYLIENYSLWTNIWDYRLSLASKTPLFFFTQTLGPFTTKDNRRAFSRIFSKSAGIALRDERSRDHLLELGVDPSKICLARDAAFVIERHGAVAPQATLRIAVSVRTMRFFGTGNIDQSEMYKSSVASMVITSVRDFGAEVTFLSTCQGISGYWTDDSILADEIVAQLPEDVTPSVVVDRAFRQPDELVAKYREFNLVIATRMHAAILSLVAATPVLGIAYEFKLEELFRQLDMDQARISTAQINPEDSVETLSVMLKNLEYWRGKAAEVSKISKAEAFSVKGLLPNV